MKPKKMQIGQRLGVVKYSEVVIWREIYKMKCKIWLNLVYF